MSTLWIWTLQRGIEVLRDRHPTDCDGARMLAAAALGKLGHDEELCCHSFDVDNGTAVGKQTVFLVWVCEEYDLLREFLESPAGERDARIIGEIPPPFGMGFPI
ncbi:hypothetical protein DXT93_30015 [Agrobacterium rhizogenes]|nr:hypothetical protein [Rhizobium rhizogenes]